MWFLLVTLFQPDPNWQFTEVSAAADITFLHDYTGSNDPEFIAGGVAAGDLDGDGWVDLFLVNGNKGSNQLLRNQGDGTFADITASAGLAHQGRFDCGPLFADVDGDGRLDLLVGGIRGSSLILYRNLGDGRFEDVTARAGLAHEGDVYGAALADVDRDGDLDLFLARWQSRAGRHFWRNNGDGTFREDGEAGFSGSFSPDYTFTPNFADIDGDRWPELLVASDLGTSKVFRNRGDGRFSDETTPVISDENGMGAAVGDYDNDGDLDWFVTAIGSGNAKAASGNRLYRNDGGHFTDVTDLAGVREGRWGWGASFADFDNDGHLDLFHVNGYHGPFAVPYQADPSRFFHAQGDGTFVERAAGLGLADSGQGRGLVCFDYDRDGDLDLLISNNKGTVKLFRNDLPGSVNWLRVRLNGKPGNSQAIGARIWVRAGGQTQMREIRAGNNFVSQDPTDAHFGLGSHQQVDLTILWPDGRLETHSDLAANRELSFSEPGDTGNCENHQARWVVHLTAADGGFESIVSAVNLGSSQAMADLQAYDDQGRFLGNTALDLAPGTHLSLAADTLFGGLPVSHFALFAPDEVVLTAGYRLAGVESGIAHVHHSANASQNHYFYPGNPRLEFDGMALVNTNPVPVRITAFLLTSEGLQRQSVVLRDALPPNAKLLALFDQIFPQSQDSIVAVHSDLPTHALLLRGTRPGTEPGLLFSIPTLPVNSPPLSDVNPAVVPKKGQTLK